jgi:hypothetical protein
LTTASISVLLLYVNPLLGEGLERLLAAEPGLSISSVQLTCAATALEAIDRDADVVVFEEGGPLGLEQLIDRIHSPVVIVMSLHSSKVWTLRRDDLGVRSDDIVDAIIAACLERPMPGPGTLGAGGLIPAREPAL